MGLVDVSACTCLTVKLFANHLFFTIDGFFDAGMLLKAMKANDEEQGKPSEKAAIEARRSVGKKLRLSEY